MKREISAIPSVYRIERAAVSDKLLAQHGRRIQKFESGVLSQYVRELEKGSRITQPASPAPAPMHDFDRLVVQQKAKVFTALPRLIPIVIGDGTRVLSPPYDRSWATGTGWALPHFDGKCLTMATDGGSTSGFCIVLSSPQRVFTTVEFAGSHSWNWSSFEDRPTTRVSGGLGTCIYRGNDATPALARRSTLFSVIAPRQFTGEQGSGPLSNVLIGGPGPTPGMFAAPFQPVSLLMEPNVRYALWLWCWHAAVNVSGTPFISFVTCNVPAITVKTSDPYFPPVH